MFKQNDTKTSVKIIEAFMPIVIISKVALAKMQLYIEGCSNEIGWLGTVIKTDDNVFFIDDVFLFKQDVHMTTTEITPEGLTVFAEELLSQPNGFETWNNIRLWGHSHVNMSTSPSGQDNNQMETFAQGNHPWFLRIIANKKGEINIDLYDYHQGITYSNLSWWEEYTDEEKEIEKQINTLKESLSAIKSSYIDAYKPAITDEINSKVSKKIHTYAYNTNKYFHNNNSVITNISKYRSDSWDDWSSTSDDGCIKNEMDVSNYFTDDELMEIAQCHSFHDVRQILAVFSGSYDYEESNIIWTVAKNKFGLKVGI